jgi:hypothetical protein
LASDAHLADSIFNSVSDTEQNKVSDEDADDGNDDDDNNNNNNDNNNNNNNL